MIEPVFIRGEINRMSSQLERIEAPLVNLLGVMETDARRRMSVGLNHQVHQIQLDIVLGVLAQKEGERNYEEAKLSYVKKIDRLKEDYLVSFDSMMSPESKEILGAPLSSLLENKKEELKRDFIDQLDWKINHLRDLFDLNPTADLRAQSEKLQDYVMGKRSEEEFLYGEQKKFTASYLELLQRLQPTIKLIKDQLNVLRSKEPHTIFQACYLGNALAVSEFINVCGYWSKATFVNEPEMGVNKFRALDYAAFEGTPTITRYLLKMGADPQLKNAYGYTPLHWAAYRGHEEIARILIQKGAQINVKGEFDRTPLHMATFKGHLKVSRFLLSQNGIECNPRTTEKGHLLTPLHNAVMQGHKQLVLALLGDHRMSPHSLSRGTDEMSEGESPFFQAVTGRFKEDVNVVHAFVEHPKFLKEDRKRLIEELALVSSKTGMVPRLMIERYIQDLRMVMES